MSDEIVEEGASSHTSGRMSARIEVVGRVSGRRRWTVEQKLLILRDAFGSGGSVRLACERHEVGSGLIYTWRRQAMAGELSGVKPSVLPVFAEVELAKTDVAMVPAALPAPQSSAIGIELPSGVRLTVEVGFDADALARVLTVLQR